MRHAKYILLLLLVVSSFGCSHRLSLEWEENFNSKELNHASWSKIPRGKAEWCKYMSNFDSCYSVNKGKLVLRGLHNYSLPNDTAPYLTGGVFTKGKVNFGIGRLEIKARLHGATGAWPAIWLLPDNDVKWPKGGEIDIMERLNYDAKAYQTVHSHYTVDLGKKETPPHYSTGKINPDKYNVYAVEIHADSLVFFINNKKTFSYPRLAEFDKDGQFEFAKYPLYLMIDMQLGGDWVGKINPKDVPVSMEVDWVRYYKFRKTK